MIKRKVVLISGFPNVLGCLDGTFVKIKKPKAIEADFLNRKGYHSLNVQVYTYWTINLFLESNLIYCLNKINLA